MRGLRANKYENIYLYNLGPIFFSVSCCMLQGAVGCIGTSARALFGFRERACSSRRDSGRLPGSLSCLSFMTDLPGRDVPRVCQ